jgi:hypothetical protein
MAQRDDLDFKIVCACSCMIDAPHNSYQGPGTYDAAGGNCHILNGKTCNREVTDPGTGVITIRSGRLDFCAREVVPGEAGARADTLDAGEAQDQPPALFNKQLILQTPTVEPGKKPLKLKPVAPLGGITTAPQ